MHNCIVVVASGGYLFLSSHFHNCTLCGGGYLFTMNIVNVVGTSTVSTRLDLSQISNRLTATEYRPKRFTALVWRSKKPRGTVLLYPTGSMVTLGCKSSHECETVSKKLARKIKKLGYCCKFGNFRTVLCVGSFAMGHGLDLEKLQRANKKNCSYEPELFTGLYYRLETPSLTCVCFSTGKCYLTGAKCEEQLLLGYSLMHPILAEFKIHKRNQ